MSPLSKSTSLPSEVGRVEIETQRQRFVTGRITITGTLCGLDFELMDHEKP